VSVAPCDALAAAGAALAPSDVSSGLAALRGLLAIVPSVDLDVLDRGDYGQRRREALRGSENQRRVLGLVGSVVTHAVLLGWAASRPMPATPPPVEREALDPVEIVVIAPTHSPTLSARAAFQGEPAPSSPALATSEPERVEPPPPKTPPSPARPRSPAMTPVTPASPASDAAAVPVAPEVEPPSEVPAPTEPTPSRSTDGSPGTPTVSGTGSVGDGGRQSGDGAMDHSAYGSRIVEIVMEEIDDDPVRGIPSGHSIRIGLRVLPSGRLARRGLGRFDFAEVLATTVGPVRTRGILRRIERASLRFPRHPAGFPRRYYEIAVTVNFTGKGARRG